jgi:phosphate transport system substrate-binding protein
LTPDASNYPYQRSLYYIYKDPASAGVQAFLGYASSPQGQQALTLGN